MSFRYHFFARFDWRDDAPADVKDWMREASASELALPMFEMPEPVEDMVGLAPWLLSQPGVTQLDDWGATVAAVVHDDDQVTMYGLVWLLAPYVLDGLVATAWTDMAPDVEPILYFVQDETMWVGGRNGVPSPATVDVDPDELVWRGAGRSFTPGDLEGFGLPGTAGLSAARGPAVARHLLARSVALGLDELAGDDPDRRAAAEAGARLVLDLLDEGGDPRINRDSPGWQLQEIDRDSRYGSGGVRATGQPITGLSAALDEVGSPDPSLVRHRLVEGEVIEVIEPLTLFAFGPDMRMDFNGMESWTKHVVVLAVPVGVRLRLTKVHEKGHAECWPVDADPFAWPRVPDPQWANMPPDPVGSPEEYVLRHVDPQDEGRTFRRLGST